MWEVHKSVVWDLSCTSASSLVGNEAQSGDRDWWFETGASQISSAASIGSSEYVSIECMNDIEGILSVVSLEEISSCTC